MSAPLHDIERAMVAIRRRQTRRSIAGRIPTSVYEALDAVEAAETAGSAPSVNDIAAALRIDQPRASRVVAAAVAAGLIHRRVEPTDGRRSMLATTAQGSRTIKEIRDRRLATFSEAMAGWSTDERDSFARLLVRFVDALDP